jgi:hypothetical protein
MQGDEYFSHYADGKWRTRYYDEELRHTSEIGLILAEKLWSLYGEGQLFDLVSDEKPSVVSMASFSIEGLKAVRSMAASSGTSEYRDVCVNPAYSESQPEDVASKTIRAERGVLGAKLAFMHDQMLSRALVSIAESDPKKAEKPGHISKIVRDNILSQNRELARLLAPWQVLICVNYDSSTDGKVKNTELSVKRRPNLPVPDWLEGPNQSMDPIDLLCSLISEIETLIVLNHWVAENHLPYLAVIAPPQFESGSIGHESRNPHADIFLCNLMPESNEIIPIQIKKRSHVMQSKDYIKGMRFITPRELGLCDMGNVTIKCGDICQTGQRVTYTYGKILNYFVETTLVAKGRKPKKAQLQGYKQTLDRAITGLENALKDRP